LAISVHGARKRWKEIWKSGSKIWKAEKSGTVGRPTVPDFSQKDKKEAMKNLEWLNLESGTTFFAKKKVKKARKSNYGSPIMWFSSFLFWVSFFSRKKGWGGPMC
jgi:hypothetical protein